MKSTIRSVIHVIALTSLCAVSSARGAAGAEEWVRRYDGAGFGGHDYAKAIAVDAGGDVFVSGYSASSDGTDDYLTIKYSNAGVALWTNRFNGQYNDSDQVSAMAVDRNNGKVFVTGFTGAFGPTDWTTLAYSGEGVPLWTNYFDSGFNSRDAATAIALDANGNVIVTGYSVGTNSPSDYLTLVYSNTGVTLRSNFFDGTGNSLDRATAVAVDGGGRVVVTGNSTGSGSGYDYATIMYSTIGQTLWTNRFNGTGNANDYSSAMAIDGSNNVIVTGYSVDVADGDDYTTIKYSSEGVPLWTNYYKGTFGDRAAAIAVDASDNVLVTGSSVNDETFFQNYVTIKYSSAGVPLWTNRYHGPGVGGEESRAIAVDGSGNVFVTGDSPGISSRDFATIAYSSAGAPLWTNRYNGPANDDRATAIAVDGHGNVFVTGISWNGTNWDYATIKYSSAMVTPIPLNIEKISSQVVLTWAGPGFGLQSAPFVTGTYTNIPAATSPYTNPITGSQKFFRLKAN